MTDADITAAVPAPVVSMSDKAKLLIFFSTFRFILISSS